MSARSAPVSSAAMEATHSPTPVSAPDNTPTSGDDHPERRPVLPASIIKLLEEVATTSLQDYDSEVPELEYPPQLGRCTVPIIEVEVTVASTIDYEREAEQDSEENNEAPVGTSPTTPWGICSIPFMSRTLTTDPRDRGTRAGGCALPPISNIRRTIPWSLGPMCYESGHVSSFTSFHHIPLRAAPLTHIAYGLLTEL